MKLLSRPLVALLTIASLIGCGRDSSTTPRTPQERIVGEWVATGDEGTARVVFHADGKIDVFQDRRRVFGDTKYKLDTSNSPIGLEIADERDGLRTLIEFTEDGRLRMADPDSERPKDLNAPGTLVFKKVK
jgi:hypothetical protein